MWFCSVLFISGRTPRLSVLLLIQQNFFSMIRCFHLDLDYLRHMDTLYHQKNRKVRDEFDTVNYNILVRLRWRHIMGTKANTVRRATIWARWSDLSWQVHLGWHVKQQCFLLPLYIIQEISHSLLKAGRLETMHTSLIDFLWFRMRATSLLTHLSTATYFLRLAYWEPVLPE